ANVPAVQPPAAADGRPADAPDRRAAGVRWVGRVAAGAARQRRAHVAAGRRQPVPDGHGVELYRVGQVQLAVPDQPARGEEQEGVGPHRPAAAAQAAQQRDLALAAARRDRPRLPAAAGRDTRRLRLCQGAARLDRRRPLAVDHRGRHPRHAWVPVGRPQHDHGQERRVLCVLCPGHRRRAFDVDVRPVPGAPGAAQARRRCCRRRQGRGRRVQGVRRRHRAGHVRGGAGAGARPVQHCRARAQQGDAAAADARGVRGADDAVHPDGQAVPRGAGVGPGLLARAQPVPRDGPPVVPGGRGRDARPGGVLLHDGHAHVGVQRRVCGPAAGRAASDRAGGDPAAADPPPGLAPPPERPRLGRRQRARPPGRAQGGRGRLDPGRPRPGGGRPRGRARIGVDARCGARFGSRCAVRRERRVARLRARLAAARRLQPGGGPDDAGRAGPGHARGDGAADGPLRDG
ncbi:hypothetical protein IWQ56_005938, partial [Coemansia nantahalensis]